MNPARRPLLTAVLALCVIGFQGFGAVHGVDHLVAPDDIVCGLCLGQHHGKHGLVPTGQPVDTATSVVPGPDARRISARTGGTVFHSARAPPRSA